MILQGGSLGHAPPLPTVTLAFDKDSVRTYDADGRLHVALTNISKAVVNPYLGSEIPDCEALGLDPKKIYQLLRDPEELAKAAPTFNRLQVLSKHVPVSAQDHQPDIVIGASGSDATFESPFLRNSLVLWAREGIDAVESETRKELSSAYRYRADMTPGTFEGKHYDGVMRDIVGNHIALVKEGRAGPDVVVGDSKLQTEIADMSLMTRKAVFAAGALGMALTPRLAKDAKLDLTALLKDVTAKNFKDKMPGIVTGIVAQTKGKTLAKDESLAEIIEPLLEQLSAIEVTEGADIDPNSGLPTLKPAAKVEDADPMAAVKAFLKDKLSPEDLAKIDEMMGAKKEDEVEEVVGDDPPPFAGMPKKGGEKDKDDDKDKDKKAMDSAAVTKIVSDAVKVAQTETIKQQSALRAAEKAVRPYVGELAIACDSAEQVFRAALKALNITGHDTLHASALQTVLEMQPVPGSRPARVAQDEAGDASGFSKRYPEAGRIGQA